VRRGSIFRISLYGLVAAGAVTLVAVLIKWLPTSASKQMDRITFVYWFATVICIAIFSVVVGVIVYSVLHFRAQPDDDSDGPPIHGHTGVEIVWTLIPTVLVIAIGVVSAVVLSQNGRAGTNPLHVKVFAQQFAWRFEYPDDKNVKSTELVVPVDKTIRFDLGAADVIHSFWVPEWGQKQDAVPGIDTHLVVTPTRTGNFTLICTELCGLGHATMRAPVRVVTAAEFQKWVRDRQQGTGGGGGGSSAAATFSSSGCGSCHTFEPANANGKIGPDLDGLAADAQKAGKPLEDYVKESIVDPEAYIVPGYQKGVMPTTYGNTLTPAQVDALVGYLAGSNP
jgi:cytochrome c oxidase subunit 2